MADEIDYIPPMPDPSLRRQLSALAQNNLNLRQLLAEAHDALLAIPGHVGLCDRLRQELITSDAGTPVSATIPE